MDIDGLAKLEDERCRGLIAADAAALSDLFSDRLTWSHSSGQLDDKAAFLDRLTSGSTEYLTIERTDTIYRMLSEGAGLATGIAEMEVRLGGESRRMRSRYLNAWADEGGTWRMVAWQSTPLR